MTKERIFITALALALLLSLSSCVTYPDVVPGTTSPVTSEPETTEDITFEPTTTEPETTEPQTSEPETTEPLSTEPETTEPQTTEPQTTEPETTAPKTSEPETTAPQTTVPETTKAPKVYPAVSASDAKEGYLTYSGINEVSSGKNIIIFLVDRFDVTYYSDLVKYDSNFFSPLTGFTYFKDNVSLYSRTFPGICSMITGVDNDFSRKRADYFEYAYQNSPFLNDLRINNYTVKLYIDPYYT
ncbi:MAG: hypothetical protein II797_05130, partial [Clostridia bacterium]|nr:hypothetical protein [Clostridia bacterium]